MPDEEIVEGMEPVPAIHEGPFDPLPVESVPDLGPLAPTETEHFPMALGEYAATVGLDPLLEAALAVFVPRWERLQTEWDAILEEYRRLPITC
jgi:hypothetical protein